MRLSTRGRYGLKAMVDLAMAYGDGNVNIGALAAQQGISDAYLEQLVASLKKAGLVSSVRGAQGGYSLSREPSQINVGDILRALEGRTDIMGLRGYGPCGLQFRMYLFRPASLAQAAEAH